MNWNLEQAITISALNLVCSDGDVDQKELKEIYDSPFFSKYVNQSMFDWYLELDLTNIMDEVSEKFPDVFSNEEDSLKKDLIFEMVNLSIADGDISENELEVINHTALSIGLTVEDVTDAIKKWTELTKEKIKQIESETKKIKLKNAKRSGFNFSEGVIMSAVLLIMIDGDVDDDEIETMKSHKFFSKHHSKGNESLAVSIMNDDDYSMVELITSELGPIFKKEKESDRIDFLDALLDLAGADGNYESNEMNVLTVVAGSMDMVDVLNKRIDNLILKLKLDNLGLTKEQYDGIIGQITSKIKSGQVKDAVALYESSFSESTEKAKEEVEKIAVENGCSSQYEEYKKKEDRNAYIVLGVVVVIIILIVQSC